VGEMTPDGGWCGGSSDSKLKEAKISSNSDMVDDVTEVIAASIFARHSEMASSLEITSFGCSAWPSWLRVTAESRSSCIAIGLAYGMVSEGVEL